MLRAGNSCGGRFGEASRGKGFSANKYLWQPKIRCRNADKASKRARYRVFLVLVLVLVLVDLLTLGPRVPVGGPFLPVFLSSASTVNVSFGKPAMNMVDPHGCHYLSGKIEDYRYSCSTSNNRHYDLLVPLRVRGRSVDG
jgi:hypothetical protein